MLLAKCSWMGGVAERVSQTVQEAGLTQTPLNFVAPDTRHRALAQGARHGVEFARAAGVPKYQEDAVSADVRLKE